jgi:hypothetical protein
MVRIAATAQAAWADAAAIPPAHVAKPVQNVVKAQPVRVACAPWQPWRVVPKVRPVVQVTSVRQVLRAYRATARAAAQTDNPAALVQPVREHSRVSPTVVAPPQHAATDCNHVAAVRRAIPVSRATWGPVILHPLRVVLMARCVAALRATPG